MSEPSKSNKSNELFNLEEVKKISHHPVLDSVVKYLCLKTSNYCPDFFRVQTLYYLALMSSSMRIEIDSEERGILPTNIYTIALAPSGFGKGHSTTILEDLVSGFREKFTNDVMPKIANNNIYNRAVKIAASSGVDENTVFNALERNYEKLGEAPFVFDSGTAPAVKQLHYKHVLGKVGSINFQVDEIGSNLTNNVELLTLFLELYDLGAIKQKITKNTVDNERARDFVGRVPANLLLYGTYSKLMDGSKNESEFFSLLEEGYARRCFFGFGSIFNNNMYQTPEEIYKGVVKNVTHTRTLENLKNRFTGLCDENYYNKKIKVPKDTAIKLIAYRLFCEQRASNIVEHEVIRKAEMAHRFFKSIKLAGIFAFIDGQDEISILNLNRAIKLTESCQNSFDKILKRERNFVRLAKYICNSDSELTHADLVEDLIFYPQSSGPRKELMDLASAWSIKNCMLINKRITQGVEFFKGEKLEKTNLNELIFSVSKDWAYNYEPEKRSFDLLPKLLKAKDYNWTNHHFVDNHRKEDNVIEGFNLVVIDVDGTTSIKQCQLFLNDYKYIIATTKSHTPQENRFRLIFPIKYNLKLDKESYKQFMDSFMMWLPFTSDSTANQRSKKWLTNDKADIFINNGANTSMVDVLKFIPDTKYNHEYLEKISNTKLSSNLERWFLDNMNLGNRNNILMQYAMVLVDNKLTFREIQKKVMTLNKACQYPLEVEEINNTILQTVSNKI